MDKPTFIKIMHYLYTAFRQKPIKNEIAVYYDSLGVFEPDTLQEAIKTHINKSSFFPRVADLLRLISENDENSINVEDVIQQLHYIIRIPPGTGFSRGELHPVVQQILKELGGKMSISMMSEERLQRSVRMKFKYAVADIKEDAPQIEARQSTNGSLGSAIKQFNV